MAPRGIAGRLERAERASVEAQGGVLEAGNDPAGGAVFTLRLPA